MLCFLLLSFGKWGKKFYFPGAFFRCVQFHAQIRDMKKKKKKGKSEKKKKRYSKLKEEVYHMVRFQNYLYKVPRSHEKKIKIK